MSKFTALCIKMQNIFAYVKRLIYYFVMDMSIIICFIHPCTHFYFSLPTEKFLRGQGEKYTRAEKEI